MFLRLETVPPILEWFAKQLSMIQKSDKFSNWLSNFQWRQIYIKRNDFAEKISVDILIYKQSNIQFMTCITTYQITITI